jgi:hypothetical protein
MGFISAQHLAPAQGFFEPQRSYNWSLEIALDDAGDQILIMQGLDSFSAPTESNEELALHYGNEVRYVAGKASFQAASLTLKDFVDMGVANAIIKWRRRVYNAESGSIGLARDYKKAADLTLMAPNQSATRIWKLQGVWPTEVSYGDLSMSSSSLVMVKVNLRYDRAIPGSNLGQDLAGINAGILTPPI